MSLLSQFFSGGVVSNTIPIEIFAVGGGGGGGGTQPGPNPVGPTPLPGGGGGAGQVLYQQLRVNVGVAYTIFVGAGGAGGISTSATKSGNTGSNTNFGDIICYGGGGGGGGGLGPTTAYGSTGGVGEGYQFYSSTPTIYDSFQHATLPLTPNIGSGSVTGFRLQSAGNPSVAGGPISPSNALNSSGGGGAFYVPKAFTSPPTPLLDPHTIGQDGIPAEYVGISTFIVGGGGGAGSGAPQPTPGGEGGGGPGSAAPRNGTANTGGGGGGGNGTTAPASNGGSGGSGGLIIRYPTGYAAATVTGNTTAPSQPGFYVYRWSSGPGSITFN